MKKMLPDSEGEIKKPKNSDSKHREESAGDIELTKPVSHSTHHESQEEVKSEEGRASVEHRSSIESPREEDEES